MLADYAPLVRTRSTLTSKGSGRATRRTVLRGSFSPRSCVKPVDIFRRTVPRCCRLQRAPLCAAAVEYEAPSSSDLLDVGIYVSLLGSLTRGSECPLYALSARSAGSVLAVLSLAAGVLRGSGLVWSASLRADGEDRHPPLR